MMRGIPCGTSSRKRTTSHVVSGRESLLKDLWFLEAWPNSILCVMSLATQLVNLWSRLKHWRGTAKIHCACCMVQRTSIYIYTHEYWSINLWTHTIQISQSEKGVHALYNCSSAAPVSRSVARDQNLGGGRLTVVPLRKCSWLLWNS